MYLFKKGLIMKTIKIISLCILSIVFCSSANAAQEFSEQQKRLLFTTLTTQPRDTWIPTGTIAATHHHFDQIEDEMIVTNETVKYDGNRFRWEVETESFEQGTVSQQRKRDIELNSSRVFIWDGTKYILYFRSGKHAIASEVGNEMPTNVNGPLKAGIIPWGNGIYTFEKLLESVTSVEMDDKGHILMVIASDQEITITIKLDPTKNFAAISQIIDFNGQSRILNRYNDYTKVFDVWVPSNILLERYYTSTGTAELISYDYWSIASINLTPCTDNDLIADYDDNTHVEFRTRNNRAMFYHHKVGRNTENILQHRLNVASQGKRSDRNCATAAIRYAASRLNKQIAEEDYKDLVTGTKKETSLYKLKNFATEQGLHCLAVKGDIETLAGLKDCQVIIHIPKPSHYVVLDHIDEKNVWLVDLRSDKFYYRVKRSRFDLEWSGRTALIVSNEAISIPAECTAIAENRLQQIKGSATGFSCTDLIQEYFVFLCTKINYVCSGNYTIYYNRYGCQADSSSNTCSGDKLARNVFAMCINDPSNPGNCTLTGEWYSRYMHACQ